MGFALWIDSETAWCAGTHEYRPMGVAVIASTSLFSARDFDARRTAPGERGGTHFRGLFASLVDVNMFMKRQPERQRGSARQLAAMRVRERSAPVRRGHT